VLGRHYVTDIVGVVERPLGGFSCLGRGGEGEEAYFFTEGDADWLTGTGGEKGWRSRLCFFFRGEGK